MNGRDGTFSAFGARPWRSRSLGRSAVLGLLPFALGLLAVRVAVAKPRLPQGKVQGPVVNDLPVPFNLQAVVGNRAISLNWAWTPPERRPAFTDFGFEVRRHDGRNVVVGGTSASDLDLAFGTYTYRVRARGAAKENGKRLTHVSGWSEPVTAQIRVACGAPPAVQLKVVPTQRAYDRVPALRMRLSGTATNPDGCSALKLSYRIDSGTGILHTGPLRLDPQGRFDEHVNALGPEDEIPSGAVSFEVTAVAENEAGPTTSSAYTLTVELQDKFAPRHD